MTDKTKQFLRSVLFGAVGAGVGVGVAYGMRSLGSS